MKRSGFLLRCVFDIEVAGSLLSASHLCGTLNTVYRSFQPDCRQRFVALLKVGLLFLEKRFFLRRVWRVILRLR